MGSGFPDQESNPGPQHWELGVLATGPPRKPASCALIMGKGLSLELHPCERIYLALGLRTEIRLRNQWQGSPGHNCSSSWSKHSGPWASVSSPVKWENKSFLAWSTRGWNEHTYGAQSCPSVVTASLLLLICSWSQLPSTCAEICPHVSCLLRVK